MADVVQDLDVPAPEQLENNTKFPVIINEPASRQNEVMETENKVDEADTGDEPEPVSIKEMLVRLDGVFPMDEAVIEGKPFFTPMCS